MTAEDLYRLYCEFRRVKPPSETDAEAMQVYKLVQTKMDTVLYTLARTPGAHDKFLLWMVDFVGHDPVEWTQEDVERIKAEGDVKRFVLEQLGGLGINVGKWIQNYCAGDPACAKMTDCGGGPHGWHLGVHCTAASAWRLARSGRHAFRGAIGSDLLRIDIKPWSPYVPW